MDGGRFDELTRGIATSPSRRDVLRLLAAGAMGGLLAAVGRAPTAAKDKPPKAKDKSKPPKDKDKDKGGECTDHADCRADEYCVNPEVGCFPRCPLACHGFDPATGRCVDACPEDQFCSRLGGGESEAGGCVPKCPQPCAPYNPTTQTCDDTCGGCLVCTQGICQNGCTGPCEICDAASGQCRGCDGPCEYCDGGVCIGCDPACETCIDGACRTTCPGGQTCCLGECLNCCGPCDRSIGLCSSQLCGGPQEETACCHGMCTNLTYDQANCGACGTICHGLEGEACCGGVCTNTRTDPSNCGGCGVTCGGGEACCGGGCVGTACPDGQTRNPATCACECSGFQEGCASHEVCRNGVCDAVCLGPGSGGVHCGTFVACEVDGGVRCHCNSCGNVCGSGEACCATGCRYVVTTCAGHGHC